MFFGWQRLRLAGVEVTWVPSETTIGLWKKKAGLKKEIELKGVYVMIFMCLMLGFLIWNNLGYKISVRPQGLEKGTNVEV